MQSSLYWNRIVNIEEPECIGLNERTTHFFVTACHLTSSSFDIFWLDDPGHRNAPN